MGSVVNSSSPSVWFERLGYAGLLPFVGLALLVWVLPEPDLQMWVATALAAYGALIVSFLGGVHWGAAWKGMASTSTQVFTVNENGVYEALSNRQIRAATIWGVVPSLLGWLGVLMPPYAGLPWLGMVLIGCYVVDRKRYPELGLGRWLTLRFRLSAVAALSCFVAAGAV
jgi:hypothetical protein